MTADEKRRLKKEGKLIIEKRSAALRETFRHALADMSLRGCRARKANEQWLWEHREYVPAADVKNRFVVTPAEELGEPSAFVECLVCHDVLHSYPDDSTHCSCGSLTVTFRKPRRGLPPVVAARDDKARTVILTAKA
jgi:hypothetical protein